MAVRFRTTPLDDPHREAPSRTSARPRRTCPWPQASLPCSRQDVLVRPFRGRTGAVASRTVAIARLRRGPAPRRRRPAGARRRPRRPGRCRTGGRAAFAVSPKVAGVTEGCCSRGLSGTPRPMAALRIRSARAFSASERGSSLHRRPFMRLLVGISEGTMRAQRRAVPPLCRPLLWPSATPPERADASGRSAHRNGRAGPSKRTGRPQRGDP